MVDKIHEGTTDDEGNYRGVSRKKEGYISPHLSNVPFPALVTAWYPKQQTIDVNVATRYGQTTLEKVQVYGSFFEATGTIQSPKIAVTFDDDGYSTIRKPEQELPTSDEYVLDNNIEALVFKTSVGYAAQSFRFLSSSSPMLNNVKPGRKITRHDDGSFYIQDEDGNSQLKHPSGLNIRIGNSDDDIELDEDFPEHEKNKIDYASGVKCYVEYPLGGKIGYEDDGLILMSNLIGSVKEEVLDVMYDHQASALGFTDDFLTEYIPHIHPCIVPTGPPTTASNAVAIQIDVQLEIAAVDVSKTTLGTIMA